MKLKEQVDTEGYKNNFTEYLPVNKVEGKKQTLRETQHSSKNDDKMKELKNSFIEYILRNSKWFACILIVPL